MPLGSIEGHGPLVAPGRALRVAGAGVVVAEGAEGPAVVGVQLGGREEPLGLLLRALLRRGGGHGGGGRG